MGFGNVGVLEGVLVVVLAVAALAVLLARPSEVVMVRSMIDNRLYLVQNLPDKQQAADLLAAINTDLISLIKYMVAKSPNDANVRRLVRNFNPDNVSEAGKRDIYTSYSVNKGEKVVLCLRSRGVSNELEDKNIIMYVAIHEIAHLMTEEVGHTPTFWENNKVLLREAMDIGIYTRVDFDQKPASYCGINITTSVV